MQEEKNILNLYLSKVAQGDKSYVSKLARRLADRLLFIPVLSKSAGQSTTRINVYKHLHSDKEVIPVFTTEKNMHSWSLGISATFDRISILGADLCAALGDKSWVSIDEGSSHSLTIEPGVVIQIASAPPFDLVPNHAAPEPIFLAPQNIVESGQPDLTGTSESVTPADGDKPRSRFQDWD